MAWSSSDHRVADHQLLLANSQPMIFLKSIAEATKVSISSMNTSQTSRNNFTESVGMISKMWLHHVSYLKSLGHFIFIRGNETNMKLQIQRTFPGCRVFWNHILIFIFLASLWVRDARWEPRRALTVQMVTVLAFTGANMETLPVTWSSSESQIAFRTRPFRRDPCGHLQSSQTSEMSTQRSTGSVHKANVFVPFKTFFHYLWVFMFSFLFSLLDFCCCDEH